MSRLSQIGKRATSIKTENGKTAITYHSTDVVTFDEKSITLNTSGWFTNTTKNRMNQTSNQFDLEFCVFQKNGNWFVEFQGTTVEFENGMTLERGK